ncbi:MAG: hypothetical protein ABIJ16_07825 [Bacteroidota bacterium]
MDFGQFKNVKPGLLISTLVILLGFCLGGLFGAYEEDIQGYLLQKAQTVQEQVYHGDEVKMAYVCDKAWEYLKLAHTHALGLGPAALLLILLLSFISMNPMLKYMTSMMMALGALGYPLYWTILAFRTPLIGEPELAKESLGIIAKPAAGLSIIAIVIIIAAFVVNMAGKRKA